MSAREDGETSKADPIDASDVDNEQLPSAVDAAATTVTAPAVVLPDEAENTPKTSLDHARACWARIQPQSPIYDFLFSEIEITTASPGQIEARLPLSSRNLLNSKSGLHGSVSATIVDWAGGIAISTFGLIKTGVSTDIHVSYVSSAKLGDVLIVAAKVLRLGRNLAFTEVTVYKLVPSSTTVVDTGDSAVVERDGLGADDGKATEVGYTREVVCHGTHTKYVLKDQPVKSVKSV